MLTLDRPRRKAVKPMPTRYGPSANGVQMTPREFDRADFERGWRYLLLFSTNAIRTMSWATFCGPTRSIILSGTPST